MPITTRELTCKGCGHTFATETDVSYCSDECRNKKLKRPERPTCKRMMDVIAKHTDASGKVSWSAVGREFNTTSKTAHIWAEQYGLVEVKFYIGKVFY